MAHLAVARWGQLLVVALAACASAQQSQQITFDFNFSGTIPLSGGGQGASTLLFAQGQGTMGQLGAASVNITEDHGSSDIGAVTLDFYNIGSGGAAQNSTLPQLPANTASATRTVQNVSGVGSVETITGTADITSGSSLFKLASGTAPFTFKITAGALSQPITFTLTGSATVTIALGVTPPAVVLARTNPNSPIVFDVTLVGGAQASQYLATSDTQSGGNWLSVSPSSGTIPALNSQTFSGTANPSGLSPGVYQGGININIGSGGNPQERSGGPFASSGGPSYRVPVTLLLSSSGELVLSQTGLNFVAVAGVTGSAAQPLSVTATGTAPLAFAASASTLSGGNWLSVSLASGVTSASTPAAVNITANPASLAPGNYFGRVDFTSTTASNSPQSVEVVLSVAATSAALAPVISPAALVFVAAAGSNPQPQTVLVSNPATQAMTITAEAEPSNTWLALSTTQATVSQTQPLAEAVSVNTAGLAPGVYQSSLEIEAAGSGAAYPAAIVLVVTPQGSCTPTALWPAIASVTDNFQAAAGIPVPLQALIFDNCGNPLDAGLVSASFGSGEAAIDLTPVGNGVWSGTWTPQNALGGRSSVVLSAQALTPGVNGAVAIGGVVQPNSAAPIVNAAAPAVSAASFEANQPIAPGAFISIFGTNLAPGSNAAAELPLPQTLGGTQVLLGGKALPLQYSGSGQINAIVPYDAPMNDLQQIIVRQGNSYSAPENVVLTAAQPAVFTQDQSGSGAGAIMVVKPDGTQFLNTSTTAGSAGDSLVIYCAGLGAVDPAVTAGAAAPLSPLSRTVNPVTVNIGGQDIQPFFAGLAPGYAGLYQVNVQLPVGITSGTAVPLTLSVQGATSPPVTVAVQ